MGSSGDSPFIKHQLNLVLFVLISSIVFGTIRYFQLKLQIEGVFTDYQLLGNLQYPVENISMALSDGVVVKAKNGIYYLGNPEACLSGDKDGCWSNYTDVVHDGFSERQEADCSINYQVKPVPANTIQSIDYSYCNPSSGYDRFVLLSDGTIWVWHTGPDSDLSSLAPFMGAILSLKFGFFTGMILWLFYELVVFVRKKYL